MMSSPDYVILAFRPTLFTYTKMRTWGGGGGHSDRSKKVRVVSHFSAEREGAAPKTKTLPEQPHAIS